MKARVDVVYYVDVLSSWCLVAEDAIARVRAEFGDRIAYEWRVAALREALDYTPEQLAWFYRRTESVTGVRLNPAWLEGTADGSKWANLAAEAARGLGCGDDRVRLAIARGAMIDGKHAARRDVVVDLAAAASGLDSDALVSAMDEPQAAARIRASSGEWAKYGVDVRPTFVVRNDIGDISVLSGCWRYDLLAQAIRASLEDAERYAAFVNANAAPAGVV